MRRAAANLLSDLRRATTGASAAAYVIGHVYGPLYPMSFTVVPPVSVGPVPVTELLPLLVNATLDASMKPVSVPPLTVKLT